MAKTVMVFGTFDRIHPGHLNFFQQARQYGDHLIVIIARDRTAQRVKGRRPLNSENDRRKMVAALNFVDRAVLGHPTDQMKVIHRFQPDLVCLGYDQKAFVDRLEATFPNLKIVRLHAYRPDQYKSSKLR